MKTNERQKKKRVLTKQNVEFATAIVALITAIVYLLVNNSIQSKEVFYVHSSMTDLNILNSVDSNSEKSGIEVELFLNDITIAPGDIIQVRAGDIIDVYALTDYDMGYIGYCYLQEGHENTQIINVESKKLSITMPTADRGTKRSLLIEAVAEPYSRHKIDYFRTGWVMLNLVYE